MPRRYLGVREPCVSYERLEIALEQEMEGPNIDEIVETQDLKLQEIKRVVFSGSAGPVKLCAQQPVLLSSIVSAPAPALMVSTHYNDHDQTAAMRGTTEGVGKVEPQTSQDDTEIDFSRAEDFLQLETPIDARKDHNMLKLAYTIPKRTFMSRILHRYPIHKKRLAFIQRRPLQPKTMEVVGNLVVGAKGGEAKEISIACQVCGQRFNRQHQFQRHILTHPDPDNKKFLCQICGKRFNRADHLNRHAILHGDVKVHKCLLCGEEFDRASHLDRHRRKHHPPVGQQPSQTPPLTPQMKSPPPMSVGFDGVGFITNIPPSPTTPSETQSSVGTNLHLLAAVATPGGNTSMDLQPMHVDPLDSEVDLQVVQTSVVAFDSNHIAQEKDANIPEPERPFPCEVCGRKFIRSTHLRRHMRIHTGEKPFACHICGRRYARGDYLRAHIHAHRRDKIHKCKHCGEVFHDLTRFADHCRLLHKDMDDEFGNPKPPPECSPPPPNVASFTTVLAAESAEEITMIPRLDHSDSQVPITTIDSNSGSHIPITLINLPEPLDNQDEVVISTLTTHPSLHHTPTLSQTPPMMSPELQLAHLQALAAQTDPQMLIQNGQVPDTANEVTVISHLPKVTTTYIDPVTHYIISNGNSNNSNEMSPSSSTFTSN